MQKFITKNVLIISFPIKLFLCDFEGGRMIEIKNEEQDEKLREVGHFIRG